MKGHEEIQQILATYGDATDEERAGADAHLATCRGCAADFDAYREVDTLLSTAPVPALPARLNRPLALLLDRQSFLKGQGAQPAFGRRLAPAAIILALLVALSAFAWTISNTGAPVTSTPTLTSTLTPTTITARETGPAVIVFASARRPVPARGFAPTPAPAPAPRDNSATLFAGSPAHATITH